MDIKDKTVVVTGAGHGIGRALSQCFAAAGANVVCADIDGDAVQAVAQDISGRAFQVDVSKEPEIQALIEEIDTDTPIDLFCSNAGILTLGGVDAPDQDWQRTWEVNVMSQVWAARHMVPRMIARGGGYLLNTASAAGLLNQVGAAPYGVTKHASVGLSEWLAFTHGDQGIKVSVLCPQAVRSEMTKGFEDSVAAIDGMLEPEVVAQVCLDAIRDERFLILPHDTVQGYIEAKASDYDRWIGGMRKLNRMFGGSV
jgi:NAD(P)-dependent dehydrogenase (short-subunit alcohol dehydrogenase family)